MSERPAYRASMLKAWSMCQIAAHRNYILGDKRPPSANQAFGTCGHKGVETILRHKMVSGHLPPVEMALEATLDEYKVLSKEVRDPENLAPDLILEAVTEYYKSAAPLIVPTGIEQCLSWDGGDGYDWTLRGTADVIEEDAIRDTKFLGKKPGEDEANRGGYADQLTAYDLMSGGKGTVALDCIIKPAQLKTKKKDAEYYPILGNRRSDGDRARLLEKVDRMHRAIESGVLQPANADEWKCTRKHCEYFDDCEFGSKPVSRVVPVGRLMAVVNNNDVGDWGE